MEVPEWDALTHSTVQMRSRAEATEISSGGGEGGHRRGFQRVWAPPGDGDLLQLPKVGDLGDGRRLASSGEELGLVEDGVEEDDAHSQQGGSDASGVRIVFKALIQAVLLFGAETRVVTPLPGHGPGGVSDPVGETADIKSPAKDKRRDVQIHLGSGSKGGHGVLDHGGIRKTAPELCRAVYH